MQTTGADILRFFVNLECDFGEPANPIVGKAQCQSFGFHKRAVLLGQRIIRFGQNTLKVLRL